MEINWYPGHMAKSKKLLMNNLKLVQAVIELLDARIPLTSKNPDIDKIISNKYRVLVLNKSDLADPVQSKKWLKYYSSRGLPCVMVNSITGEGIKKVIGHLNQVKPYKKIKCGEIRRPVRIMVVGIPNVGKSAFINKLTGRASAKTGDRPGITKGKQWIKIRKGMELLDTPGVLWPKFTGEDTGFKLAAVNAIAESAYDNVDLALSLLDFLKTYYGIQLAKHYDIELEEKSSFDILQTIGFKRGCLKKGNNVDMHIAAATFLKEFRAGKISRITMDRMHQKDE